VTIVDLPAGTTVSGLELFEAVQTLNGVGQSKIGGHQKSLKRVWLNAVWRVVCVIETCPKPVLNCAD